MAKTHISPSQVPAELKKVLEKAFGLPWQKYRTTQFSFVVTPTVEIVGLQWHGGSGNAYVAVKLDTMEMKPLVDHRPWPQNEYAMPPMNIPPGVAIVKQSTFRGKNHGVTFYIHPDNAPEMLPAPEESELDRDQKIVLVATRTFKPSYGGIKNFRLDRARKQTGITPERWETAKASLIANGYLTKAGALSPKGRNAAGQTQLYTLGESRFHRTFSQLCRLAEEVGTIAPPYGTFIVRTEQYDKWRRWKEASLAVKQAGSEPNPMPNDITIYLVSGWFCPHTGSTRTGNAMWDTHGGDVWKANPSRDKTRLKPCSRRDATHVMGDSGSSKIPSIIKPLGEIAVIGRGKLTPEQTAQAEKEWVERRVKPRQ